MRQVGFTVAPRVTARAVRSYRTFSSLPKNRRLFSVALSLRSPSPGFLRHPVSKTLGLSSLTGSPCPRDSITNLKSNIILYQSYYFVKKKGDFNSVWTSEQPKKEIFLYQNLSTGIYQTNDRNGRGILVFINACTNYHKSVFYCKKGG